MDQPEYILTNGTCIKVDDPLGAPNGLLIKQEILDRRTPGVTGQVCGIVGGHGGDVYWVRHDGVEDTGSAYGWWEFELVQPTPKTEPPTRYDLLKED
jgi:hypothetical protein